VYTNLRDLFKKERSKRRKKERKKAAVFEVKVSKDIPITGRGGP
jgi:hypothetical protein